MFNKIKDYLKLVYSKANKSEVDALYSLLYDIVHDLDGPPKIFVKQTQQTFGFQWAELSEGEAMLSDAWFKENVATLIAEHELLIDRNWFKGKNVLDLGCGGGRWSYGLASLGANITAVDVNQSALDATQKALAGFENIKKRFIKSPLEDLPMALEPSEKFDLVWSWGVIHHCESFNKSLENAMRYVKESGLIYLYLYGRESVPYASDIAKFKKRLYYNSLKTWKEKKDYLLSLAKGDKAKIHQLHDMLAPIINRRLEYDDMKTRLETNGFHNTFRTVNHTELFMRAIKGKSSELEGSLHYQRIPDHWLKRYTI
ncbi:MAG: class I SAM-dependent methyltransferase [Cyclobacteriaceae bacterium]|jgi:2-polyprenyl-3-methyl-5-hydroxy-6-metoxy-1,4-benzoquinol methylase